MLILIPTYRISGDISYCDYT